MRKNLLIICISIVLLFLVTFVFMMCLDNTDTTNDVNTIKIDENNENIIKKVYVIKNNKLYISNDDGKTLNEVTDYENFDGSINTIYVGENKVSGALYLYKKIDENVTYIFIQTDMAMSTMCINVYKTEDSGKTYFKVNVNQNVRDEGFLSIKKDGKIEFVNKDLIFIHNPLNGGDNATLYISNDGLKNLKVLDVLGEYKNNKTQNIEWKTLYDYYDTPVIENNVIYLNITQGSDNDVGPYKYIKFKSEDFARTWKFVGEFNDKSVYYNDN